MGTFSRRAREGTRTCDKRVIIMDARTCMVASILILAAIASSEGAAPVEAKLAPVDKAASLVEAKGIYQSNYEAPIETTQQEVEDGADDVLDMLLQIPQKSTKTEAKLAPVDKAASLVEAKGIYQSNYEAPIETTQQEVEDGADAVFDMLLQIPTPTGEVTEIKERPPTADEAMMEKSDKEEPEPEDNSYDDDEPIGAGAGDFVEEGADDYEAPKEQPKQLQASTKVEEIQVEEAPKKAPVPMNMDSGLEQDKGAMLALNQEMTQRAGDQEALREAVEGKKRNWWDTAPKRSRDVKVPSTEVESIINPPLREMKRMEVRAEEGQSARKALAKVYIKAYHHLEHIGDTKEDRYQSVVKKEREKYEMDKIQGINPFSGKMKAWMAANEDDSRDEFA